MQVYEAGYAAEREDLTGGEDPYLMWIDELLAAFDAVSPVVEVPEVGEGDTEDEPF